MANGLDYFGARHYSSMMGRFMSPNSGADATVGVPVPFAELTNPQSLNLYSYVGNNPLSNVDSDGHDYHVCADNGNGGQNCVDLTDDQFNALVKQQNGQQGITFNGGFPSGSISCGGSNCGSFSYFEKGLVDESGSQLAGIALGMGIGKAVGAAWGTAYGSQWAAGQEVDEALGYFLWQRSQANAHIQQQRPVHAELQKLTWDAGYSGWNTRDCSATSGNAPGGTWEACKHNDRRAPPEECRWIVRTRSKWANGRLMLIVATLLSLTGCMMVKSESDVLGEYELKVGANKIILNISPDKSFSEEITWQGGKLQKRSGKWLWANEGISFDQLWIPPEFAPQYILQADAAASENKQPRYTDLATGLSDRKGTGARWFCRSFLTKTLSSR